MVDLDLIGVLELEPPFNLEEAGSGGATLSGIDLIGIYGIIIPFGTDSGGSGGGSSGGTSIRRSRGFGGSVGGNIGFT